MTNGHQRFLEQNAYGLGSGDLIGLLVILAAIAVLICSGRCFEPEQDVRAERVMVQEDDRESTVLWEVASGRWRPAKRRVKVGSGEWEVAAEEPK